MFQRLNSRQVQPRGQSLPSSTQQEGKVSSPGSAGQENWCPSQLCPSLLIGCRFHAGQKDQRLLPYPAPCSKSRGVTLEEVGHHLHPQLHSCGSVSPRRRGIPQGLRALKVSTPKLICLEQCGEGCCQKVRRFRWLAIKRRLVP